MADRPIPFSGAMVRALMSGTKTQTRRVVKPQPPADKQRAAWYEPGVMGWAPPEVPSQHWHRVRCPYGHPGDRLWVREAWRTVAEADALPPRDLTPAHRLWYEAEAPHQPGFGKLRPGMFMPRWASRITLEVTGVRVERLQDISEADAIAEGVDMLQPVTMPFAPGMAWATVTMKPRSAREAYAALWESINGPDSWSANPWVWVISFRRP